MIDVRGAYLAWNPINEVLSAFNGLHPHVTVAVDFIDREQCPAEDDEHAQGFTLFPDDGSPPAIYINREVPWIGVPDVIAHELAHVVAGIEADHGPEFEAAYEAIWSAVGKTQTITVAATAIRGIDAGGEGE